MNKRIARIEEEYGIFATMGLAHMLTVTKQMFSEEKVASEIEKIHTENRNEKSLITSDGMESILLAARDISELEFDDLIQFIKENFQTTEEQNKIIEKEENEILAIKKLFSNYETNEPENIVAIFNDFSLDYKIVWNTLHDTYTLINIESNCYLTIADECTLTDIVESLKDVYPELYEEVLLEVAGNEKSR